MPVFTITNVGIEPLIRLVLLILQTPRFYLRVYYANEYYGDGSNLTGY